MANPLARIPFIGRDGDIEQLNSKVENSRNLRRIIAVTGAWGIGKTELARQFLRLKANQFNAVWITPRVFRYEGGVIPWVLEGLRNDRREAIIPVDFIGGQRVDTREERIVRSLLGIERVRSVIVLARQIDPSFAVDRLELSGLNPPEGLEILLRCNELRGYNHKLSEAELLDLVSKAKGNPRSLEIIPWLLERHTVAQVLLKLDRGFEHLAFELQASEAEIVRVVKPKLLVTNEALLHALKRQPEDLHRISSRKFEELIAELLDDMGYEVQLTPASKDGGKDILAVVPTRIGRMLCLVETKHYNPKRPIQVGLVRQLFGTYMDHGASSAMLVTSSRFTRGARQFQARHEYQIYLHEYEDIIDWIHKYKSKSPG